MRYTIIVRPGKHQSVNGPRPCWFAIAITKEGRRLPCVPYETRDEAVGSI